MSMSLSAAIKYLRIIFWPCSC